LSRGFKPRRSILPKPRRDLWPALRAVTERGFVLYGGTAIALQFGHRTSVDFDFFTDLPFDPLELAASLSFLAAGLIVQSEPNTLMVLTPAKRAGAAGVKLSFFGGLEFGRFNPPLSTDDGILRVASLDDLMATKLVVLQKRVEARDYQDLAAMIEAGISLSLGLGIARAMYGAIFQPAESLKAMTFFQGEGLDRLSASQRKTLIDAAGAVRDIPRIGPMTRALFSN